MSNTLQRLYRHLYRATAVLAALLLAACASSEERTPPPVAVPEAFSGGGDSEQAEQWWTSFDDPALDQLVEQSLDANLDLKVAYERLQQARAVLGDAASERYPSLDATATAERRETENTKTDTITAGLSAEYEVDLWGRIGSQVKAERFRVRASLADYRAAALSLTGELTLTWMELLEQRAQLSLARDQLETNRNVARLIEAQFGSGQGGSADLLRQRQLVAASEEQILTLASQTAVLEHRLAVLLGEPPSSVELPDGEQLPALPPLPETGVPAELVQRRPDLISAHSQLRAADADLAAAVSERFPRLTLTASSVSEENDTEALFDNWVTNLAANLVVPLIDGGQRRAEADRRRSLREQRLYQYGQATLDAFREVEDALVQERQQGARIESLRRQRDLADTTYRQLRAQYVNGMVSYIEVLTALRERQALNRDLLSAQRQQLDFRIALYRALAGGFEVAGDQRSESP